VPVADLVPQTLGDDCNTPAQVLPNMRRFQLHGKTVVENACVYINCFLIEQVDVISETEYELEVHIKNARFGSREVETLWS